MLARASMTGGGSANELEPGDHPPRVGLAHPDKPALLFDGGRVSYAELDALSDRFADGLRAAGIGPGDAVGLQLPNIPQFVVAYFGILKAGCVVVPMNVLLKAPRGGLPPRRLAGRGADHLGRARRRGREGRRRRGRGDGRSWSSTPGVPEAPAGAPVRAAAGRRARTRRPLRPDRPRRHRGDRLHLGHHRHARRAPSSRHFQLYMNADTPGRLFGIRDDDVILARAAAVPRLRAVEHPQRRASGSARRCRWCRGSTPPRCSRSSSATGVTVFEGVPTMYIALLNHPDLDGYDIVVAARSASPAARRSRRR